MIYNVNIEETINGEFKVEANSKAEAIDIARKNYYDGIFVNEPGNLTDVKVAVAIDNKNIDEWVEI